MDDIDWLAVKLGDFHGSRSEGHRYWDRTRPKAWLEAETEHRTRFGPYWTAGTYHWPEPGFVGLWQGYSAPPPRIGDAAPNRWPDTPAGVRPFVVRWYQAVASAVVTQQQPLSNDPHSYQRLRDLKAHIRERGRESGAAFQNREGLSSAEFAHGIRRAELDGIELYRRNDQLRWHIDAKVDDEKLDFSSRALEHESIGGETGIIGIGRGIAAGTGRGIDSAIAFTEGLKFEEVTSTVERRRKRPPRERKKVGRKPVGDKAMIGAERVKRHREKLKLLESPKLSDNDYDTGNGDSRSMRSWDRGSRPSASKIGNSLSRTVRESVPLPNGATTTA